MTDTQRQTLCKRYPRLRAEILAGDFKVDEYDTTKEVIWVNTAIFRPTLLEMNGIISKEFAGVPPHTIVVSSGLMRLIISGPKKGSLTLF